MAIQKLQPSFKFNDVQLKQLRQIAPEAFKDNILDFNILYELLSDNIEDDEFLTEHYGINWPGKLESKKAAAYKYSATLIPCPDQGIYNDETNNIFIAGENLETLKILQKSYSGRIKMIYIDPPYNTGKDFIYSDDFSQTKEEYLRSIGAIDGFNKMTTTNTKADGRYHSKWLSMMYPRLKLCRNLLHDTGVIFVSIDQNEVFNLRHLMNEIFGEENFVLEMIVNKASEIASNDTVAKHEYTLIYCKDISFFNVSGIQKYTISRGTVGNEKQTMPVIEFPAGLKCLKVKDGIYNETRKIDGGPENIENLDPIIVKNGLLDKPVRLKAKWRSSNDMRNFFANNCQLTKAKISGFIEEIYFEGDRFMPQIRKKTYEKIPSLMLDLKRGSSDLEELNMEGYFDFPKSKEFIKKLISLINFSDDDIVLDFFAGSGTTGQAVMEIAKDEIKRKFICVQLPELLEKDHKAYLKGFKDISEVACERLKRASKILEKSYAEFDIGFKVFQIASSNFKSWTNYSGKDLKHVEDLFTQHESSLVDDWNLENLLTEILLLEGFPLDSKIEKSKAFRKNSVEVATSDSCEHALYICLDKKVENETIQSLELGDNDVFICLDNAVTDQDKVRLDDKGLIKTI